MKKQSKTQANARAGLLAGMAAGHEQAKVDRAVAAEQDRAKVQALLDLDAIRPRPGGDTRKAGAEHVLELAESIAALGLLQPLAVDRIHHLVAGLHREVALRLLLTPAAARVEVLAGCHGVDKLDPRETARRLQALPDPKDLPEPLKAGKVPCLVLVDLDAERDLDAALAAEAAENTARKQYTAPEVEAIAERLRAAGYRETAGRPGKGSKQLRPALASALGVHVSTVRRLLGEKDAGAKRGQVAKFSETLRPLAKAVARAKEAAPEFDMSSRGFGGPKGYPKFKKLKKANQALFAVLDALDTLEAELEDAVAEAKALETGKD